MIPADNPIMEAIDRFRRAFRLAGIAERDVKVTWDGTAGWCRLRCRLPDGRVIERVRREDPATTAAEGRAERLLHEMSVWTRRAAKRAQAGEEFTDESVVLIGGAR